MDPQSGPPPADPLIGQTIGNYLVTQKVGEGGMGSVYLAEHPSIGKKVALKVLHSEFSNNEDVAQRFFHEAKAVNNIGHPNIVDIVDYGVIEAHGKVPTLMYFIMEYLAGQSLAAVIRTESPLPPERALGIAMQVADALAASHKCGIVHRDLKPDNVMLQQRGRERDFVKLLDFGIAKVSEGNQPSRTRTGLVMGTPAYMSPEQCEGKANVDHRTDVYALGIMLYEMLTGRVPFIGEGYGEILVQHLTQNPVPPSSFRMLPPHVEVVVLKALEKRADMRFPSMDEFMRAMSDPVGYVESNGGPQQFLQRQLTPSNVPFQHPVSRPTPMPFMTGGTPGTPPPGSLSAPSGIYGPGSIPGAPSTPTPTTMGAAAGQATGGGKSRMGFMIAALLILAGAGIAIAVVISGKSSNGGGGTNGAGGGTGSNPAIVMSSGDAGAEKTVAADAAIAVGADAAVAAVGADAAATPALVDAAVATAPVDGGAVVASDGKWTIHVTSTQPGATILLDGKDTGVKTPGDVDVEATETVAKINVGGVKDFVTGKSLEIQKAGPHEADVKMFAKKGTTPIPTGNKDPKTGKDPKKDPKNGKDPKNPDGTRILRPGED
jgi:serine/threonine-protein kinase